MGLTMLAMRWLKRNCETIASSEVQYELPLDDNVKFIYLFFVLKVEDLKR